MVSMKSFTLKYLSTDSVDGSSLGVIFEGEIDHFVWHTLCLLWEMQKPLSLSLPKRLRGYKRRDEKMIREMASDILVSLGYDVILAHNGAEGIKTYKENQEKINVVILDLIIGS